MKTLTYILLFLITTLSVPETAFAQDNSLTEKEQLLTLIEKLNSAVDSADHQEIARIGYAMERFFGHESLHKYARYYAGYAWYRVHTLSQEDSKKSKEDFLDSCINHLEKTIDIDPKYAEAQALLGSAYGMKATGMLSGMKYGPKSDSAIEKAMKLDPENPRVYMIKGIGEIYKPSMFGGGVDNALASLGKAAELFKTYEPNTELDPDWGHAEVYAWIGQAHAKQGNYGQAEEAYEQALQIDSTYGWVKYQLLPALAQQTNE